MRGKHIKIELSTTVRNELEQFAKIGKHSVRRDSDFPHDFKTAVTRFALHACAGDFTRYTKYKVSK